MAIQLPPTLQAKVAAMLSTGNFADEVEVLDEALRLLDERESEQRLHASLIEAEAQMERGEIVEWTVDTRAKLWRDAQEMAQGDVALDPELWP